jgi:hypothetical protein
VLWRGGGTTSAVGGVGWGGLPEQRWSRGGGARGGGELEDERGGGR